MSRYRRRGGGAKANTSMIHKDGTDVNGRTRGRWDSWTVHMDLKYLPKDTTVIKKQILILRVSSALKPLSHQTLCVDMANGDVSTLANSSRFPQLTELELLLLELFRPHHIQKTR